MSLLVKQKNKKGGMQANYRKQCMINTHSLKEEQGENSWDQLLLKPVKQVWVVGGDIYSDHAHTHTNCVNPKKKPAKQN